MVILDNVSDLQGIGESQNKVLFYSLQGGSQG